MCGFDRLNPAIRQQYVALNPWTIRFTAETDRIRRELERDPGVRVVLDRIRTELAIFPPPSGGTPWATISPAPTLR